MPMLTIVTFTDADGDEFPVGIYGIPDTDEDAERLGRKQVNEFVSEGSWRPRGDLTLTKIEYPSV